MKNCYTCTTGPYNISAQRFCYDKKIDYLLKNPLINRQEQKKIHGKNTRPYSFENMIEGLEQIGYEAEMIDAKGNKLAKDSTSEDLEDKLYKFILEEIADPVLTKAKVKCY